MQPGTSSLHAVSPDRAGEVSHLYKSRFCITSKAVINCNFFFFFPWWKTHLQGFSLTAAKMKSAYHRSGFCHGVPVPHFRLRQRFLSVRSSWRRWCRWGRGGCRWGCDEPVTPVPCWPSYNLFKYCNTVRVRAQQCFSLLPLCDSLHAGLYLWFMYTKARSYASYSFAKLE